MGAFPAVAVKVARQRCMELRAQLAAGVDPAAERRLAKQQLARKDESFEAIAREWYAAFSRNWSPLAGASQFVFSGERSTDRPMSNNTLNAALRRFGYRHEDMTAHGFRSMASTLLNELGWSSRVTPDCSDKKPIIPEC
jgi:hypothetical protein